MQLKNYERWEDTAVDLGMARHPFPGEDTNGEYIVWGTNQACRVINLDEMSLSTDPSDRPSGRPSQLQSAMHIVDSGESGAKGGHKVTVVHGMNTADEALPPYIMFPTKSQDAANYKLKFQLLASFRQVPGKFGYSVLRYHDTGFGMNPKGGMNAAAFHKYVLEHVSILYPDATDFVGQRVLLKLDSGPGRFNVDMLTDLRARGFYVFPGVPNGTEVGQEMDQVYAYAKHLNYKNRDALYKARVKAEGSNASLSMSDIGYIIFGSSVPMIDGTELRLCDAFDKAFDPEHLQRARFKCGYLPSTRASLKRHKI